MASTNRRESCNHCKSSNNICYWTDPQGNERSRCLTPNCSYNKSVYSSRPTNIIKESQEVTSLITSGSYKALLERGISEETCREFNYQVLDWQGKEAHLENHYDKEGNLVAQKIRVVKDKKFYWQGDSLKAVLGKRNKAPNGKAAVIICEGSIDAMSVFQVLPKQTNTDVIYLTKGAGEQTKSEIKYNLDVLNEYEKVIFCLDNDKAGQFATEDCIKLFAPGKVGIITLRYKDPNEYLQQEKVEELQEDINTWKLWVPKAITAPTLNDTIAVRPMGRTIPYPQLHEMIRGVRPGRIYMVLAGPKAGKSTFTKEMILSMLEEDPEFTAGVAYLEEPVNDSALSFLAMDAKIPYFKYEEGLQELNKKHAQESYDKYIGNNRLKFLDASFMKLDGDELIYNLNFMATVLGYKLLVLDHVTMISYDMNYGGGSERKDIDILMKNLRKLAHETNVAIFVVCHLRRSGQGLSWDQGREITMADGRGSGAYEQLCDVMIGIERNLQSDIEKGKTKLKVLANRITGQTGYADVLYYLENTGRLVTIDQVFK